MYVFSTKLHSKNQTGKEKHIAALIDIALLYLINNHIKNNN